MRFPPLAGARDMAALIMPSEARVRVIRTEERSCDGRLGDLVGVDLSGSAPACAVLGVEDADTGESYKRRC